MVVPSKPSSQWQTFLLAVQERCYRTITERKIRGVVWIVALVVGLCSFRAVDVSEEILSLGGEGLHQSAWSPTQDIPFEVCFLTSVYATSTKQGDRPPGVRTLREANPSFEFMAFTNLPDLDAPGWTLIFQNSTYRRLITQSRWPKFMGWKHPAVQKCQAVFYMDGYCRPRERFTKRLQKLAREISQSKYGLFQNKHHYGMGALEEFKRILEKQKDTEDNVQASIRWLQAQSDFDPNCTLFNNQYIGYDPRNCHFHELSEFFWKRYEMEEDSWRDQPLWCYVLDHFHVTPQSLGPFTTLFKEHPARMGHNNHRYANATRS